MKRAECDIASVTVGNDKLSSLRMLSMFRRQMLRKNMSDFISFKN